MGHYDFSNATLVLVGHGSTLNAQSGEQVLLHATELRSRKIFAQVREAFWKQEPRVQEVLPSVTTPFVFVVPLFISEGYFTEQVIPRELGFLKESGDLQRVQQRGAQTLFYCKPVGTHDRMTEVLLARARGIVKQFPFPREPQSRNTTLFVAGHGTTQNENSRQAIERQVELIRAKNIYADVHAVFIEEDPKISDCYQIAKTRNVVVVPFFISNGMHVAEDIPMTLGEPERLVRQRLQNGQPTWRNPTERKGKLVWYSSSVGSDPQMAEVVLERVNEMASVEAFTALSSK